jgi:hypothetical protein
MGSSACSKEKFLLLKRKETFTQIAVARPGLGVSASAQLKIVSSRSCLGLRQLPSA